MNQIKFHNSCDEFDLLISCASDDELSFDEQMQLALHLKDCESCRARRESFAGLNELVVQLGMSRPASSEHQFDTGPAPGNSWKKTSRYAQIRWKYLLMRVIPAAVAATVIVGLFAPNWSGQNEATATEMQVAEIVAPLFSVTEINLQRIRDQHAFVETLELELRALKLEIASIKDQEKSKSLTAQIEALWKKTKSIEFLETEIP